jgi:hypothetical protein
VVLPVVMIYAAASIHRRRPSCSPAPGRASRLAACRRIGGNMLQRTHRRPRMARKLPAVRRSMSRWFRSVRLERQRSAHAVLLGSGKRPSAVGESLRRPARGCAAAPAPRFGTGRRGRPRHRPDLTPSNPMSKALVYARGRIEALQVFLSDPDVAIDTNHIERALRPIPMGRRTSCSPGPNWARNRWVSSRA